jgi:spermidine synthase
MIPWVHLDSAKVPGGDEFKLMQRGDEFWIMVGTNPLMTSRMSGSEEVLADVTCTPLAGKPGASVLIGGLGMGFTLRRAQALLGKDAAIVVAELVPGIIAWARGPLTPVFKGSLDDPRTSIVEADVGKVIGESKARYDAILLDVDNGPEGLSRPGNDRLYGARGLASAKAALRPGGVLAIWSAHPDDAFTKRLKQAGFSVEEVKARANGKRGGSRHLIWLARKG